MEIKNRTSGGKREYFLPNKYICSYFLPLNCLLSSPGGSWQVTLCVNAVSFAALWCLIFVTVMILDPRTNKIPTSPGVDIIFDNPKMNDSENISGQVVGRWI